MMKPAANYFSDRLQWLLAALVAASAAAALLGSI